MTRKPVEKVEPVKKAGQAAQPEQPDYERWLLTMDEFEQYTGHPILQEAKFISYGEMGTGKSSFWSTFPGGSGRGNLVLMFDASAKAFPYLRGLELEHGEYQWDPAGNLPPIRYTDCFYPGSNDFWGRVEYYEELDADFPLCYETFSRYRAPFLRDDLIADQLGFVPYCVILDSLTTMQLASLRYQEALAVGTSREKDNRLQYGDMKRDMVREAMVRFSYARYNVAVLAHEEKSKDEFGGGIVRGISAVGKLGSELPAQYSEVYRHYAKRSSAKEEYKLQTHHNGTYPARTAIGAPDPCDPHFTAIWKNYGKTDAIRFGLPK